MRGVVAIAALLSACSALLPPPSDEIACAVDEFGNDPCAERGLVCSAGFCRTPEVCNGIDDDLDSVVDEGFDGDGDRFTFCGGATAGLADCDDADPLVHPADPARGIAAADEICDGKDNQCDGEGIDSVSCSVAGEVCSRTLGACVTPVCSLPEFQCGVGSQCVDDECRPGDCTTMPCEAGQVCDPVTRACVVPQPIGASCNNDADCVSQRCLPLRTALGVTAGLPSSSRNVCTTACCTDADCPEGYACWAPGSGARACVQRSTLAAGPLGAPDESERTCTRPGDCGSQACILGAYEAHDRARRGMICGGSAQGDAESCQSNGDCASGVCLFGHSYWWFGTVNVGPCTAACRTSADCTGLASAYNASADHALTEDGDIAMGCMAARATDTSDWVQLCLESSGGGAGSACRSDADCLDRACVAGVCRGTCCNDASCGTSEICRAISRGDHYEMLCAPPLTML